MRYYQIPGQAGYKITKDGRVFSFLQQQGNQRGYTILDKPTRSLKMNLRGDRSKYLSVSLHGVSFPIHRLMAKTFLENPKNAPCVAHLDGNPLNNNVTNLAWVTAKENEAHKILHGTKLKGEQSYKHKLTETEVKTIKWAYHGDFGLTQACLGQIYGVSKTAIRYIIIGRNWKHLTQANAI